MRICYFEDIIINSKRKGDDVLFSTFFQNAINSFNESLSNNFSQLWIVIVLNIFFIVATYTDIKYMKIYDKFNIAMLLSRVVVIFINGIILHNGLYIKDWIMGGAVIFLTFLLLAMYSGDRIAGDIKFGGNIGLWIGFYPSILLVAITMVSNLIFRLITLNKKKIPLAPFFYFSYICLLVYYFVQIRG